MDVRGGGTAYKEQYVCGALMHSVPFRLDQGEADGLKMGVGTALGGGVPLGERTIVDGVTERDGVID